MRLCAAGRLQLFSIISNNERILLFDSSTRIPQKQKAVTYRSVSSLKMHNIDSVMNGDPKVEVPPMIDVDCNLIHEDLSAILANSSDVVYENIESNLRILFHPSTISCNIKGVFSPASTIEQAESFHSKLVSSSLEATNGILVKMSVGVHPYNVEDQGALDEVEAQVSTRIEKLFEADMRQHISCIGETGLDYSDGFPDREKQLPWFQYQLELAKKYKMPLFVHERLAFEDTTSLIDKVFPDPLSCPPIVVHCFTGTKEECLRYVERGYFLSISGYILKSGDGPEEVRRCLRDGVIPMDKLMIETDAPYMGFNGCRDSFYEFGDAEFQNLSSKSKKRILKSIYPNVPSALPRVLETVVDLINEGRGERGEEVVCLETASNQIFATSKSFFRMDSV